MKTKRLLLLFTTTGYNAEDFARAAQKLGVEVVFGTDRCRVLNDPWRDAAIPLRFHRPEESARRVRKYAERHPIDGVIAVGDKPTITAAMICKALGTPINSPRAVQQCRNKYEFRKALQDSGLLVPGFQRFAIGRDPQRRLHHVQFPCVLKPLSLSASQGVIRADNEMEFLKAFHRIRRMLETPAIRILRDPSNQYLLVEDYVEGEEVALEGLLTKGRLRILALFDKPDLLEGPFFEETIYVTPSRFSQPIQRRVARCASAAAKFLGLQDGPVHAEFRINKRGVWILELAARSIGGLCSRALRFGTGMSLEELIIRHALGMKTHSTQREARAAGVLMLPIPRKGYLRSVEGIARVRQVRGIHEVAITAKLGQKLIPWPEGSSYLGFIFARGPSPGMVERALRDAHAKLTFNISPDLPVL